MSTVHAVLFRRDVAEHRPQKKQLERFHLDGPELAQGLFAAVGGDSEALRRDFTVLACATDAGDPQRVQLRLAPKGKPMRERLQELVLTMRGPQQELCAVAYRDPAGDLVEIELGALRRDPDPAPSADLAVPKDTVVVEHAPQKPKGQ
jgi:hypothetical protein